MSWLSREQLRRSFELAGFEAAYNVEDDRTNDEVKTNDNQAVVATEQTDALPVEITGTFTSFFVL